MNRQLTCMYTYTQNTYTVEQEKSSLSLIKFKLSDMMPLFNESIHNG